MRQLGPLTMTLFVLSLYLRLRLHSCKHIPKLTDGDRDDAIGDRNSTEDIFARLSSNNTNIHDFSDSSQMADSYDTLNETERLVFDLYNTSNDGNKSVHTMDKDKDNTKQSPIDSTDEFPPPPRKELPLAMIIAGPAAAVSIFLFLCIAYYFHNLQLNQKMKRLSITLYVAPDPSTGSSNCESSNGHVRTHKLVPAPSPSPIPFGGRNHSRDADIFASHNSQRRKSIMPPSSLGVPNMNKRGSNWSAIADKEILSLSAPRRHSTFII